MVDRLAKVLHAFRAERYRKWFIAETGTEPHGIEYEFTPWKSLRHEDQDSLRAEARATIEAMREPTDAMLMAKISLAVRDQPGIGVPQIVLPASGIRKAWQGLIDEALKS